MKKAYTLEDTSCAYVVEPVIGSPGQISFGTVAKTPRMSKALHHAAVNPECPC